MRGCGKTLFWLAIRMTRKQRRTNRRVCRRLRSMHSVGWLAIKTSATVPANAFLPAPVAPAVLTNLAGLTVTALNGSSVTVNTGIAPPAGGGFEIRLRDFAFMPGEDPTLVMRGAQPNLTCLRVSASDRFYIRMYDGSTPPNYSEFSTALFINLPLSS